MQNETFCPRLWNEVYINEKGNIFGCCYAKPQVIGNIYLGKLEDIYNNEVIQKLRQKSLSGQLECFAKCNLLDKEKIRSPKKTLTINYRSDLKRIKVMFGAACNIKCVMCRQNHNDTKYLDYTKLIENINIEPFESIEIQGGEPLFIPAAKSFFEYAASKHKKVSFLTNGLLINDEWADKITLNSSFLSFSINAATKKTHEFINWGSRWKVVLRNIQKIRDAREKYDTQIKIKGHMTIVKENVNEIPLFIRSFKQLGFDAIDFGYDGKMLRYLKFHPFKKIRLRLEIKKAMEYSERRSSINLLRLKMLRLV